MVFFKYILLKINSLISYKFSSKIITTSSELKKFISKSYLIDNKKIIIIPNCIDTDKFKRLNIKKYKNKVINISRLENQKNLYRLLDICNLSNLDLDLIGTGTQLNQLKRYAKKFKLSVKFLGQIKNSNLPKILSKYIFYLSASKIEGSPKTIMEAMSSELPIFGLKADGLNSLVKNNYNGYLSSDTNKLCNKIKVIKKNNLLLKKMGKKSRLSAVENFSLRKNIIIEKRLFKELIK